MLPGRFTLALIGLTILAMTAGQVPGAEEKSPPFSTLVSTLTLEGIADQLLEGLPMGHDPMPKWQFSEQQVEDLLFYIESVSTED